MAMEFVSRALQIRRDYRTIAPVKPRLLLTDDPDHYVELRQTRTQALRVAWRLVCLVVWTLAQQWLLYVGIRLRHHRFRVPMRTMYLSIRVKHVDEHREDITKDPNWYHNGIARARGDDDAALYSSSE